MGERAQLPSSRTLLLTRLLKSLANVCGASTRPGTVLGVGAEPSRAASGLEPLTTKREAQME